LCIVDCFGLTTEISALSGRDKNVSNCKLDLPLKWLNWKTGQDLVQEWELLNEVMNDAASASTPSASSRWDCQSSDRFERTTEYTHFVAAVYKSMLPECICRRAWKSGAKVVSNSAHMGFSIKPITSGLSIFRRGLYVVQNVKKLFEI
jgi:hypothetical protein